MYNPISHYRKAAAITQARLAQLAGLPIRTVQKYEKGELAIENMTLKTAANISRALNINILQLLEGD